jgi:hypothetical protein
VGSPVTGEARAEREPPLLLVDDAEDQLVEAGLADAEGLEDVGERHLIALEAPEPREDGVLDHGLHFPWNAGEDTTT